MKKKLVIVGTVVITIAIIALLVLFLNKTKYIVKVSIVDDQSPDRILTVYENTEKIEVKRIELSDGTLLCNGYNTTVHFGDVEKEKELRVVLNDNSIVTAKIVIEEVK